MHLSNSQDAADQAAVLLVEDEDLLRELLEETLSAAGFGVVTAASGEEAPSCSKTPVPRALVTHINLARAMMDGWELARVAREHDPGCAIVYVSGDSAHSWAANGVPRSLMLSKPFAPAQLVDAVSNILNGA